MVIRLQRKKTAFNLSTLLGQRETRTVWEGCAQTFAGQHRPSVDRGLQWRFLKKTADQSWATSAITRRVLRAWARLQLGRCRQVVSAGAAGQSHQDTRSPQAENQENQHKPGATTRSATRANHTTTTTARLPFALRSP